MRHSSLRYLLIWPLSWRNDYPQTTFKYYQHKIILFIISQEKVDKTILKITFNFYYS